MLSSLAPARRRFVLALFALAALVALVSVVAVTVALVVRTSDTGTAALPVAQSDPGPVLLVPGYGGSTSSLDQLAGVLRARGKTVQVFHLPGDGTGDLDTQAKALASAANELQRGLQSNSIDVVGYSAGGVVARLWVRDHDGAAIVRRVITLGSPHHGTDLAGAAGSFLPNACPTACRELVPGSDLLRTLNAQDETPSGPAFVSIWTTRDNVVLPPSSARLSGALNVTVQSVCPADQVQHGGLPGDAAVQAMVVKELAAGPPVALGRADCPASS